MFQGFYNLTSGMLCQNRNLNVTSNNMANVSTAGYKRDRFVDTTFKEAMLDRTGNKDKGSPSQLGTIAMMKAADQTVTSFENAGYRTTRSPLDFAIDGNGFFEIQTPEGVRYTRNGSFILDNQGYLALEGVGRVLGHNGPIYLGTDNISVNSNGSIYNNDTGRNLGRIRVVEFANHQAQLVKVDGNLFIGVGGFVTNEKVVNGALENSNVEAVDEMVNMMSSQRALQSAASVMTSYDKLIEKIVNNLGPA